MKFHPHQDQILPFHLTMIIIKHQIQIHILLTITIIKFINMILIIKHHQFKEPNQLILLIHRVHQLEYQVHTHLMHVLQITNQPFNLETNNREILKQHIKDRIDQFHQQIISLMSKTIKKTMKIMTMRKT